METKTIIYDDRLLKANNPDKWYNIEVPQIKQRIEDYKTIRRYVLETLENDFNNIVPYGSEHHGDLINAIAHAWIKDDEGTLIEMYELRNKHEECKKGNNKNEIRIYFIRALTLLSEQISYKETYLSDTNIMIAFFRDERQKIPYAKTNLIDNMPTVTKAKKAFDWTNKFWELYPLLLEQDVFLHLKQELNFKSNNEYFGYIQVLIKFKREMSTIKGKYYEVNSAFGNIKR